MDMASGGTAENTLLLEITLQKIPRWLENRMRQLKPNMYEELKEAVTRYISTSKPEQELTLFTRPDQRGGRWSPNRESKGMLNFGQRRHTQESKEGYKNNNNGYDVKMTSIPPNAIGVAREAITNEIAR